MSDLTSRAFAESLAIAALAPVLRVAPGSIPRLDCGPPHDPAHAWGGRIADQSTADRAPAGRRRAAGDRHAIPAAHDISPSPAKWVVTLAKSSLYLGVTRSSGYRSHRDSVLFAAITFCSSQR